MHVSLSAACHGIPRSGKLNLRLADLARFWMSRLWWKGRPEGLADLGLLLFLINVQWRLLSATCTTRSWVVDKYQSTKPSQRCGQMILVMAMVVVVAILQVAGEAIVAVLMIHLRLAVQSVSSVDARAIGLGNAQLVEAAVAEEKPLLVLGLAAAAAETDLEAEIVTVNATLMIAMMEDATMEADMVTETVLIAGIASMVVAVTVMRATVTPLLGIVSPATDMVVELKGTRLTDTARRGALTERLDHVEVIGMLVAALHDMRVVAATVRDLGRMTAPAEVPVSHLMTIVIKTHAYCDFKQSSNVWQ